MRSFKTHLEEGRDAPLYHATNSIYDIIKFDILKGNTDHNVHFQDQIEIDALNKKTGTSGMYGVSFNSKTSVRSGHFSKKKLVGTSLTRSLNTSRGWHKRSAIIKLNQRKLSQRHKILPINIFAATGELDNAKEENLYEEFVMGDVKTLHKYVDYIIVEDEKSIVELINTIQTMGTRKCDKFRYHILKTKETLSFSQANMY